MFSLVDHKRMQDRKGMHLHGPTRPQSFTNMQKDIVAQWNKSKDDLVTYFLITPQS